jgi:ABC transporter substrate binding protein
LLTLAVSKFRSAAVFSGSELCYPFGHTHGRRWPVRRRDFIALFGGSAAWPLAARAQQAARLREVAVWMARPNDMEGQRRAAAFRERLQVLGWTVGRNIRTDYHWVTGDIDRTRMAKEIVEQRPDVIVVESTVGVEALASESSTIPMIFVNLADPVGSGFVETLPHPGRNITGFMGLEPTLGSKWPELLKEIAPTVAQLGFLFDNDYFESGVGGGVRQNDQPTAWVACDPCYGMFDLGIVANMGRGHFHSEQASSTLGATQEGFRIGRSVWQ